MQITDAAQSLGEILKWAELNALVLSRIYPFEGPKVGLSEIAVVCHKKRTMRLKMGDCWQELTFPQVELDQNIPDLFEVAGDRLFSELAAAVSGNGKGGCGIVRQLADTRLLL